MHARRPLLALLVVATIGLAFLAPRPAAADREEDCDNSLTTCDVNQMNYVIPMEARQLSAIVPIHDTEEARQLYRQILPDVFDMPEELEVSLWVVDVHIATEEASAVHWMEGWTSLRMSYQDEDGWFHLSMPTNSTDAYDLGREAGFPKYMADMSYEETDGSAHTRTEVKNASGETLRLARDMQWRRTEGEPGTSLERLTAQDLPQFGLFPVFEGPTKYRVKYTPKPYIPATAVDERNANLGDFELAVPQQEPLTALSDPQFGQLTYQIDPDLDAVHADAAEHYDYSQPAPTLFPDDRDLSDLIPTAGEVPGMFWHAEHNLVIQSKDLGEEGAPAASCAPADHPGGDWPHYGQNLDNHRRQPAEDKIGPDNVATLQPAFVFPTAAAGRYYVEEYSSELQREDALSGTPIVAGGCVYAGTRTGMVFALNADTGEPVWITQVESRVPTLAYDVAGDVPRIFVNVADFNGDEPNPYMAALDARTGELLWKTGPLDDLRGSELTGSPTAFTVGGRHMVMTGVSGWPGDDQAQEDWYTPGAHRGSWVILDQESGDFLQQEYVIPDEEFCQDEPPSEDCHNDPEQSSSFNGQSGGGVWTTAAVDQETGYAYYGVGNPSAGHPELTNSLIKIDVDPARRTFGHVAGYYQGDRDGDPYIDVDFGSSPNVIRNEDGSTWLTALQKSGTFHVADADTMEGIWSRVMGAVGTTSGNAATAATDGGAIYQPIGPGPMQLFTFGAEQGTPRWTQPLPGQGLYGPATLANGVVYVGDQGILRAFDSESGTPLLTRPVWADVQGQADSADAGVSVARNTVYTNGGNYLVAYRLPGDVRQGDDPGQGPDSGDGEQPQSPAPATDDAERASGGTRTPPTPATGGGVLPALAGALLLMVSVGRRRSR